MAGLLDPLAHGFRALRHRNFRLFLSGQLFSLVGTWLQSVALGWLLYRLTHSAFLLGLAAFLAQVPSLLISPLAGVWVDRWNRHRMVIATQALSMVQAMALAALVLTGHESVPAILALNLVLGLANAVDVPARQSLVFEMVSGSADLPNAIALNASAFNLARLVGPALAGPLIALLGEGNVFLLNGLSYLAVIAALLAIRLPPGARRAAEGGTVWGHLREGLAYVGGFAPIRAILGLLAFTSLVGTPIAVLLPVFAGDVLRGDARTYGLLVGGMGVGALLGALYMATRVTVLGLGRVIVLAVSLFGGGLVALSLCRHTWLAVPVLAVMGFGTMVQVASTNTVVQTLVDPAKRGRVMSFYAVALMGMSPVGALVLGAAASHIGAPWTAGLSGLLTLAAAVRFSRTLPALRAVVRPIYARMGILPAEAAGEPAGPAAGG